MAEVKLFDPYGQEIVIREKRPPLERMGAVRVRDQWSNYPTVKLTPDKLASILREADQGNLERQAELFEEMEEKDPILGSLLHTRRLAVQGLDYTVHAASKDAADQRIAEAVKEQIDDLNMEQAVMYLLDAIGKGFSALEIAWRIDGGRNWIGSLDWIHAKRWTYNEMAADWNQPVMPLPRLLTDEHPIGGEEVPAFKVVFHRYVARAGFAQRGGLLRSLAYFYVFKNYDIKDWVIFLEKYGMPLRIGKFMPGAGEEDKKILREAIQNLGTDAGALISDQTAIDIVESKTTGVAADVFERAARYFDRIYEIAILGQTATTEGTPGKLGAEDAQSDVRRDILEADARALQRTITDQLIWPWVGFNFGWDKKVPQFRFDIADPDDLEKTARIHAELVGMGVPIPLSFVRKKYSIPEPEGDEPVLVAQSPFGGSPFDPDGSPFGALSLKKKIPIGRRMIRLPR